ncbi:hypothetical protein HCBG_09229 [Histoplasma capsulatum G186AR]|uniref:Uncharacterized protein n=1 Tax=Ajellomyces capsulatus (strain G186AR / H82 / ATCC MYA-2454 / RMSCC 2432) TaxID=447093 RepID=C0P1E9_AJECG|nr:uncharacterized protein HCBG_09229 [Histoplasma capsulatum G186AR]EEH02528.1 hypothetical protein HCBG_09229 [Histoplasma capsulatum G186AR]
MSSRGFNFRMFDILRTLLVKPMQIIGETGFRCRRQKSISSAWDVRYYQSACHISQSMSNWKKDHRLVELEKSKEAVKEQNIGETMNVKIAYCGGRKACENRIFCHPLKSSSKTPQK